MQELERTLGVSELQDWHRFWAVEPWGSVRDNMHAGIVAAAVRAPYVKRGKQPPTFKDFMLRDPRTAQEERRAHTAQVVQRMKAAGKRKRNG